MHHHLDQGDSADAYGLEVVGVSVPGLFRRDFFLGIRIVIVERVPLAIGGPAVAGKLCDGATARLTGGMCATREKGCFNTTLETAYPWQPWLSKYIDFSTRSYTGDGNVLLACQNQERLSVSGYLQGGGGTSSDKIRRAEPIYVPEDRIPSYSNNFVFSPCNIYQLTLKLHKDGGIFCISSSRLEPKLSTDMAPQAPASQLSRRRDSLHDLSNFPG
jgi:hypothetical protein